MWLYIFKAYTVCLVFMLEKRSNPLSVEPHATEHAERFTAMILFNPYSSSLGVGIDIALFYR